MDQAELTQSFIQDQEKNQFLSNQFKYEKCPHCERNFFQGKLQYHLKLCKPSQPMIKSPVRKNKKSFFSATFQNQKPYQLQQKQNPSVSNFSPQFRYQKCLYCRATFPLSMINKHLQKCNSKPKLKSDIQDLNELKARTKINFDHKKDKEPSSALPRIRNSAKQHSQKQRNFGSHDFREGRSAYTVKIRQQLSCFKKALQVQQVQCNFCNRRFSKQASLRHIPICEKLKSHQIQHVVLKKQSKSEVYKLNIPPKKNLLFQSKMMTNVNEKEMFEKEIKSARLIKHKKVDRQKVNNTSFLKKSQDETKQLHPKQNHTQDTLLPMKQSIQLSVEDKTNTLQVQKMNMTFSKIMENKQFVFKQSIELNPQSNQNSQTLAKTPFFEEIPENKTVDHFQAQEEQIYSENENQFLQVSESKKSFFGQINIDDLPSDFKEKKQNQDFSKKYPSLQKLKLKIDLKDFQK